MLEKVYGCLADVLEKGAAFKFYRSVFPVRKDPAKVDLPEQDLPLKLRLLLSAWQMVEESYPLRLPGMLEEKYADYVYTKDEYEEVVVGSPMLSVDCEMVMTTGSRMELARICVVDEKLEVIYHSLVKPRAHITDYKTRYSGVTKAMLEDVTTRLEDVQRELRRILPSDAILVGQSLNSDLNAMRMLHPYVIDTSVIYNLSGERRRKTKLAVLSSLFLKEEIQGGEKRGHDPKEDAIAAM
jgi:RNA exonuclease 1